MEKRRAMLNTAAAGMQVLVSGVVLIVLYRFLYDHLGIEAFGVWAVVLATTAAVSAAGMGLGTSVVKFVAQHMARDDRQRVSSIVQTAAVSVAVSLALALLAFYPVLQWVLHQVITPASAIPDAMLILPLALLAFWLISIGSVFQGSLDGLHRVDIRALVVVAGQIVFLALCVAWVPQSGLIGIARAQVVQGSVYCIGGWFVLRHTAPFLPLVPAQWKWRTFKEIIGYGVNFQIISVSLLLLDPVTKALLARLGGVGLAGYYEMAYRMAFFLRSLVVTSHQALVPTLAQLTETRPDHLPILYRRSFHLLALLVAVSLPLLLSLTQAISIIWLGELSLIFVTFASVVLVASFLNMLGNPAYFAFMGNGQLGWNVVGHVVMGFLNLSLGLALGRMFGGPGIVVGFAIAFVTGSIIIATAYQRANSIAGRELVQWQTLLAGAIGLGLTMLTSIFFGQTLSAIGIWPTVIGIIGVYLVALLPLLWTHPMRTYVVALGASLFDRSGAVRIEK
jgi:O-antigen/teichoic acid export membrane protein